MNKKDRMIIYLLICSLFIYLCGVGVYLIGETIFRRNELRVITSISVGMPECDLLQTMGKPDEIIYNNTLLSRGKGYTFPTLTINNKVYIYYVKPIYKIYIYIDKNNRIEYVFYGKT